MKEVDEMKRSIGLNFNSKAEAEVRLWSPESTRVEISLNNKSLALVPMQFGYWQLTTSEIKPGDLYKFIIDGGNEYPDPASLSQPQGVHGPSQAVDLKNFKWSDGDWNNPSLSEYIFYELHVGTFTKQGTFEAISEKLDHLKELGINAIEIMPVAQFAGDRNWGYDGVFPFAPHHAYGGVRGLQELVGACHSKGIAVVLDVVYNHLGPEGNYLGAFGPYFTGKYRTPWGPAINFDDAWSDGVRNYFIENALMWFRDFHIDALRLDAVHAIKDFSPVHILREIKENVDELMKQTGRRHHLIVELDLNDNRFISPVEEKGYGMDAQWIDEFHHALRVAAGGETHGYYSDFSGVEHLAKAYRDAYVYDGQFSPHRKKRFGVKTDNEGHQFVVFSQNHDQVGNRMLGERTSQLTSFEMQKLLAAAVMVSPFLPMLFMGEEWSEPNPFIYFVSHTDPELADAVREGRKKEFAAFHPEGETPDPLHEESFSKSKLQWDLLRKEPHKTMLEYYRSLIGSRKSQPALFELNRKNLSVEADAQKNTLILNRWNTEQQLICFLNFSKQKQTVMPPSHVNRWQKIFDSASLEWKGPGDAPAELIAGAERVSLNLQPESILIYCDKIVETR